MVTLRLFHAANPFRPIEQRTLQAGEVLIGRDPAADWAIEDEACELSRRHCAVRLADGRLSIRDLSANGVFVGPHRKRIAPGEDIEFKVGEPVYLGQFMIAAEAAPQPANDHAQDESLDALFHAPMLQEPDVSALSFQVRSVWGAQAGDGASKPQTRERLPDAALLEAFCEGAGLDPSMLLGEDPKEVMRRAGAIYQQAVLGLSDLMGERTSLKTNYQMNRTTVSAADNNPFKWADAHRVAVDLLRPNTGPFLAGPGAVNASFQDLKKHLLCLMAGSRAAVSAALEELAPARIEADAGASFFQARAESNWRAYQKRHDEMSANARETTQSAVTVAFKTGYERHLNKLNGLSTVA